MKHLKSTFLFALLGTLGVLGCGQSLVEFPTETDTDTTTETTTESTTESTSSSTTTESTSSSTTTESTSSSTTSTVVEDTTPPSVLSTDPQDGDTEVAFDAAVQATFSEAMDPQTIDGTSFTVMLGATPVPGTVSYVDETVTFTPASDYPQNATLTATVTTAATDLAGNPLSDDFVWSFQTGSKLPQGGVNLGSASTFAILAFNTVTNVNNPGTIVTGDLGISPGAALVGFPPGQIVGDTHAGDSVAANAKIDLLTAYNDAAGRLGAAVLPGDLSGLTFYPGLYKNSTSVMLSAGNFTLDTQGDSNAVFIFQMGSTFTSSPGTQMILSGGAKATNIYWAVGTSATLGTNSIFKGTLLAASALTMDTGAVIEGRLLALGAAVALDTNIITVPSP